MAIRLIKGTLFDEDVPVNSNAVLNCPNCHRRHGGEIGDTSYVSWRCSRCRWYTIGRVTEGKFFFWVCSLNEFVPRLALEMEQRIGELDRLENDEAV